MSVEEIACQENITPKTIYAWKQESQEKGDDWERARSATRLASDGIDVITAQVLEDYAFLINRFMEKIRKESESETVTLEGYKEVSESVARVADAYMKLSNAIKRANPHLNELAMASKVLKLQENFIREKFPQYLPTFAEILQPFSIELNQKLK
jgi:excinuclease UvrABC helicase subunit UvrB